MRASRSMQYIFGTICGIHHECALSDCDVILPMVCAVLLLLLAVTGALMLVLTNLVGLAFCKG